MKRKLQWYRENSETEAAWVCGRWRKLTLSITQNGSYCLTLLDLRGIPILPPVNKSTERDAKAHAQQYLAEGPPLTLTEKVAGRSFHGYHTNGSWENTVRDVARLESLLRNVVAEFKGTARCDIDRTNAVNYIVELVERIEAIL